MHPKKMPLEVEVKVKKVKRRYETSLFTLGWFDGSGGGCQGLDGAKGWSDHPHVFQPWKWNAHLEGVEGGCGSHNRQADPDRGQPTLTSDHSCCITGNPWRFDWNVNLCGLFGFLQGMAWEDVAHGNLDIKNWRFMRPSWELAEVAQMKKVWKRLELFSWNMLTWKNVTCIQKYVSLFVWIRNCDVLFSWWEIISLYVEFPKKI